MYTWQPGQGYVQDRPKKGGLCIRPPNRNIPEEYLSPSQTVTGLLNRINDPTPLPQPRTQPSATVRFNPRTPPSPTQLQLQPPQQTPPPAIQLQDNCAFDQFIAYALLVNERDTLRDTVTQLRTVSVPVPLPSPPAPSPPTTTEHGVGTDSIATMEQGIDAPVMMDGGTDAPRMSDNGTDAPLMADNGTDAPVMVDNGTDAPVMADQGTSAVPVMLDQEIQATHPFVDSSSHVNVTFTPWWMLPEYQLQPYKLPVNPSRITESRLKDMVREGNIHPRRHEKTLASPQRTPERELSPRLSSAPEPDRDEDDDTVMLLNPFADVEVQAQSPATTVDAPLSEEKRKASRERDRIRSLQRRIKEQAAKEKDILRHAKRKEQRELEKAR